MLRKSIFSFILSGLWISLFFLISNGVAPAQSPANKQNRIKDFGWSLKEFERTEKKEKTGSQKKPRANQLKDSSNNAKETNRNVAELEVAADDEVVRGATDLIVNDVLVVNEKGNAVVGLKKSDFIITEDATLQEIELFGFGEYSDLPRSIVLVFFNGYDSLVNIKNKTEAAKTLVDKFGPKDKMAIVTTDIKLILDFTTDKALLKKTIDELASRPKSNLVVYKDYGTLLAVLGEMFDEKDTRPIVIFQTGGMELHGLKMDEDTQPASDLQRESFRRYRGKSPYGFRDVIERIQNSRATIYSIVPMMRFVGLSKEEQLWRARVSIEEWMRRVVKENDARLISEAIYKWQAQEAADYVSVQTAAMKMTKLSGGYTDFVEKPEDAESVYETIFKVINNRYTIGYYSTNQLRDGKRRRIKTRVRNHPEYIVVGRESYLPREKY